MAPEVCPCQTDIEEPGPHLPSCPWANQDYDGEPADPLDAARADAGLPTSEGAPW